MSQKISRIKAKTWPKGGLQLGEEYGKGNSVIRTRGCRTEDCEVKGDIKVK